MIYTNHTNFWKLCFQCLAVQGANTLHILRIFSLLFIVIISIFYAPTFLDVASIQSVGSYGLIWISSMVPVAPHDDKPSRG
jgi:hypothetical protein